MTGGNGPTKKNKICLRCGVEFAPAYRNQRYCDPCRLVHRKEYEKEYKRTQKSLLHKRYHQTTTDVVQPPPEPIVYQSDPGGDVTQKIIVKNKKCLRCGVEYIPTGGAQKYCSKCKTHPHEKNRTEYQREWRQKNPEKCVRYRRNYVDTHREELKERGRRDGKTEKRKKQKTESVRRWTKRHPEQHRKRNSEWRKANKDKVNFMNRRREHQIRGATGSITWNEWDETKEKFNYTCPCCGKSEPEINLTIDHIIPISKGGTNNIDNIQPLCGQCNSSKFDRVVIF